MSTVAYQKIHAPCEVVAMFVPGKKPIIKRVVWAERIYEIVEVTIVTKAKKGAVTVWLINVASENAALKLRFDTDTLDWWVEELLWEE
jgi:hypothetical protein